MLNFSVSKQKYIYLLLICLKHKEAKCFSNSQTINEALSLSKLKLIKKKSKLAL